MSVRWRGPRDFGQRSWEPDSQNSVPHPFVFKVNSFHLQAQLKHDITFQNTFRGLLHMTCSKKSQGQL